MDDPGQFGRVTQAMAYMMYAEMVMYQNDDSRFSKALGYMKEIIADSRFHLNPDFANIWETNGEWCNESIWEINYEHTISERDWGDAALNIGGTVLPTLFLLRIGLVVMVGERDKMVGDFYLYVLKLMECSQRWISVVMLLVGMFVV